MSLRLFCTWMSSRTPTIRNHAKYHSSILDRLKNFESKGIPPGAGVRASSESFSLEFMKNIMLQLGDPISKYKVVHVAGSKGKGSTVAFLSSILRCAGFKVGTYTSPHLRELRERIIGPANFPISQLALDDLLARHSRVILASEQQGGRQLTHFEALTAIAYKYFEEQEVDIAVIETGMGGIVDATNVIPVSSLAVCIITSLGLEHVHALGGSIDTIARAKAGILKPGVPLVLAQQSDATAEAIVMSEADSMSVPVAHCVPPRVTCTPIDHFVDLNGPVEICTFQIDPVVVNMSGNQPLTLEDARLSLVGSHQHNNATCAVVTSLLLRSQGWNIDDVSIKQGLESNQLSGRFQILSPKEAMQVVGFEATVILDGAHTEDSAVALSNTVRRFFPHHPVVVVVAMANDKDHAAFGRTLLVDLKPFAVIISEVPIAHSSKRSTPVSQLAKSFRAGASRSYENDWDGDSMVVIEEIPNFPSALDQVRKVSEFLPRRPVVVITGSLHAVGMSLSRITSPEE